MTRCCRETRTTEEFLQFRCDLTVIETKSSSTETESFKNGGSWKQLMPHIISMRKADRVMATQVEWCQYGQNIMSRGSSSQQQYLLQCHESGIGGAVELKDVLVAWGQRWFCLLHASYLSWHGRGRLGRLTDRGHHTDCFKCYSVRRQTSMGNLQSFSFPRLKPNPAGSWQPWRKPTVPSSHPRQTWGDSCPLLHSPAGCC